MKLGWQAGRRARVFLSRSGGVVSRRSMPVLKFVGIVKRPVVSFGDLGTLVTCKVSFKS